MKAIEILFNEIDKLNTKIKETDDINDKVGYLSDIVEVSKAINQIAKLKFELGSSIKDYL